MTADKARMLKSLYPQTILPNNDSLRDQLAALLNTTPTDKLTEFQKAQKNLVVNQIDAKTQTKVDNTIVSPLGYSNYYPSSKILSGLEVSVPLAYGG